MTSLYSLLIFSGKNGTNISAFQLNNSTVQDECKIADQCHHDKFTKWRHDVLAFMLLLNYMYMLNVIGALELAN